MQDNKVLDYIKAVLKNLPTDWLNLTTHRLDIFEKKLAKVQFLEHFDNLYKEQKATASALQKLPTAFDYIRLGHPLSCVLEWAVANRNQIPSQNVISFSSKTITILAILRKNLLAKKHTHIFYTGELPAYFDVALLKEVYGYQFDIKQIKNLSEIPVGKGSTIFISQKAEIGDFKLLSNIDFFINIYAQLGSMVVVNGAHNESYISEIQHVRRRETVAMTPANCLIALKSLIGQSSSAT